MKQQDVGPALKRLRAARGLSVAALAKRCTNLEGRQVRKFEDESTPRLDTLGRLLDGLQADLRDLHWAIVEPERPLPPASPQTPRLPSLLASPEAVGCAVQLLRQRAGLSLSDFADAAQMHRAQAFVLEAGRMPHLDTIERILGALDATLLDLHEALVLAHFVVAWRQKLADQPPNLQLAMLALHLPHLDPASEAEAAQALRAVHQRFEPS